MAQAAGEGDCELKHGLVVGKFYPFHKGHAYLIETALQQCEDLTIVVVANQDQRPPGQLREQWLKQAYPQATVRLVDDIYKDDDSQAWADYTIELLGKAPDIVFTSEEYGDRWAELMGCQHVLVDLERRTVPISGTQVRQNPLGTWQFLDPGVRAYYAKRVAVVGADSTGTTTLTKALAKHYQTSWVPEYGRLYTEGKITSVAGSDWAIQELVFIAQQQNQLEDQLAGSSNKILFCDTDSFTTALWHELLIGSWSAEIERLFIERRYDQYFLTNTDIPYAQDAIRVGAIARQAMHERFVALLEQYHKPYQLISGPPEARLAGAVTACNKLLH